MRLLCYRHRFKDSFYRRCEMIYKNFSPKVKADKDILLTAMSTMYYPQDYPSPLAYAPAILRADRDVALYLRYSSTELRNDREIVLIAVAQNGLALEFASPIMVSLHFTANTKS